MRVFLTGILMSLLMGCSLGGGYIMETGMKKCVAASVEAGSIDVSTVTGPSVNITGQGIRWHSFGEECEDVDLAAHP